MIQFKGIRTIDTPQWPKNLQVTWFSTSESWQLRQVLIENWIIIMWVEEFWDPVWKLYEVGIFSKKDGVVVNVIFSVEWKIRDAFDYFLEQFGIIDSIKYIKPYGKEIEESKLQAVLELLKKD